MTIETEIPVAVVDDGQQAQARQPVRVHHAAMIDRADRGSLVARDQHAIPFHAAGAHLAEGREELAADRPCQLAAQPGERVLAVGGKLVHALQRPAQLAYQFLEAALLVLEALQFLGAILRLGFQRSQRLAAAIARGLQLGDLALLLRFQRREPFLFGGQLLIQRVEFRDVAVDRRDLAGARAAEVLVIREHPAGLCGVLLVEQ